MEDELKPLPCENRSLSREYGNVQKHGLTIPVTIRPTYSWVLVVELVRIACTVQSEHVKGVELDGRLTVPIIMVIAPVIIILFLPMRSPNTNTKRLPTAQPISWTPRTLACDCHVKTIQLTYIATYSAKKNT